MSADPAHFTVEDADTGAEGQSRLLSGEMVPPSSCIPAAAMPPCPGPPPPQDVALRYIKGVVAPGQGRIAGRGRLGGWGAIHSDFKDAWPLPLSTTVGDV